MTGDNFSRVKGSFSETSLHSAARILVPSGTVNPACSAIQVAGFPTIFGFNFAPAQFCYLLLHQNRILQEGLFFLLTK